MVSLHTLGQYWIGLDCTILDSGIKLRARLAGSRDVECDRKATVCLGKMMFGKLVEAMLSLTVHSFLHCLNLQPHVAGVSATYEDNLDGKARS